MTGYESAPRVNRGLRLLGRLPDRARQHAIELPEHLNGNQRGFARSVFEDVESDRSLPALVNVFRIDQDVCVDRDVNHDRTDRRASRYEECARLSANADA